MIDAAHRTHTRVVLTVQSFAWSSGGSTKQKALLGSSTARAALAKNIAVAVRDRGADGVNLDFEPLASGYADDPKEEYKLFYALGIDGLFSDFPDTAFASREIFRGL